MTIVLAVDPGLANTGIVVVEGQCAQDAVLVHVDYVWCPPVRNVKTMHDDARRAVVIAQRVRWAARAHQPDQVRVEWYAPRPVGPRGQFSKRGWTTVLVVGAVLMVCDDLGVPCVVGKPPRAGEAEAAAKALGLREPAKAQPHLADACVHALRGLG